MKANMYRDVYLKDITEEQIGQTLKVSGWVENIRDHGGVSFQGYVWCPAGCPA